MKRALLIALRNDSGQLLIVENKEGKCSFPGDSLEASQSVFVVAGRCMKDIGLSIRGITPLRETFEVEGVKIEGVMAYVEGGKLLEAPNDIFFSASWVSPTVAARIETLNYPSRLVLEPLMWVGGVRPR